MLELKRGAEVTDDQEHHPTKLSVIPLERLQARGYSQMSPHFAPPLHSTSMESLFLSPY